MKQLAFIVMAHSEPVQVGRLTHRLSTLSNDTIIHVNSKSDILQFKKASPKTCSYVKDRIPVTWGTNSLLAAIFSSVRYAMAHTSADRIILLSQNCFPVASDEIIRKHFDNDQNFISYRPMRRFGIDRWRLSFDLHQNLVPNFLNKGWIGKLVRRTGLAYPSLNWPKAFGNLQPMKGCLWWALTRSACHHLINEYKSNEFLNRYANSLFGPEEIIPHTIIANSAFGKTVRHHVTYEDWTQGGASPAWLSNDIINILNRKNLAFKDVYGEGVALFARKFKPINIY